MVETELEKDMTPKLIKDLGMRFATEKSKRKYRYGLYECQYCGKEFEAGTQYVKRGHTKSCGCQRKGGNRENTTHGMTQHRLYKTWDNMMRRCHNKNTKTFKNYGGRGIIVCERWHSVENFIDDMFPSFEEGLSLDRIDLNGNYEPDNCRWTTREIQARNTRKIQKNNTSGFRGVSWRKDIDKYRAYITINNKTIHLGYFYSPEQGALVYDTYVRENNLEHTKNFSDEEYYEMLEKYKGGI